MTLWPLSKLPFASTTPARQKPRESAGARFLGALQIARGSAPAPSRSPQVPERERRPTRSLHLSEGGLAPPPNPRSAPRDLGRVRWRGTYSSTLGLGARGARYSLTFIVGDSSALSVRPEPGGGRSQTRPGTRVQLAAPRRPRSHSALPSVGPELNISEGPAR